MTKQAGVWMDHRGAIIVFIGDRSERTQRVESGASKHERVPGLSADDAPPGDHRDRQFADHLDKYYDDLIRYLGAAEAVFLFGPGEAKGEFHKRMESKGFGARIVAVETADKMTEPQVAARVREHFRNHPVS